MVKIEKKRKIFTNRSIYMTEADFGLDKEIAKLAITDTAIPEEIRGARSSLTSYVTVELWKLYKSLLISSGISLIEMKNDLGLSEVKKDG